MQHDLTVEHVPIHNIRPHPRNPRNGDTTTIAESLRLNGQYKPIVLAADGTALAGNHTYMAAMELGWDTLDAVRLPIAPDSPEAERIMLADNRTADRAWYDDALLLDLLEGQDDLRGTGYDRDDVDSLRQRLDAYDGHQTDLSDLKQKPAVRRTLPVRAIVSQNPAATAIAFAAAHLGFEQGVISTHARAWELLQERHPLTFGKRRLAFLDNDWLNYDHPFHLDWAARLSPVMATTRDIVTKEQADKAGVSFYDLDTILGWAADLAPHVDEVILIPKYDCLDEIPPTIGDARVVLGYSVPSSYGATPLDPARFAGRPVHLLGGGWGQQRALLHLMGEDVVAFDNNNFLKVAQYGNTTRPDGTGVSLGDLGYENHQQPGRYVAAAIVSLLGIATDLMAWNGGDGDALEPNLEVVER